MNRQKAPTVKGKTVFLKKISVGGRFCGICKFYRESRYLKNLCSLLYADGLGSVVNEKNLCARGFSVLKTSTIVNIKKPSVKGA